MATQIFIAPGYGGSGEEHWQTFWEKEDSSFVRIEQRDWFQPSADEWSETIEAYIGQASGDVIVVAHSLACIALVHWAQKTHRTIKGALLVAPPEADDEKLRHVVQGFSPVPLTKLPFKSIVLASTNDPYNSIENAERFARSWGSDFINIGAKGHINAQSMLQNWPEGRVYLSTLL